MGKLLEDVRTEARAKQKAERNLACNNWFDRLMMGVGAFGLVALSYLQTLHYIKAMPPFNYAGAGCLVALLLYVILAPIFRK